MNREVLRARHKGVEEDEKIDHAFLSYLAASEQIRYISMYEPWLMRNVVRNRKAAKPNFCIDLEKLDHKVHTLYCELSCLTDGTSALHTADDSFYTPNNVDFSRVNFKTFKPGFTMRVWECDSQLIELLASYHDFLSRSA
jgi:hypothetical protein